MLYVQFEFDIQNYTVGILHFLIGLMLTKERLYKLMFKCFMMHWPDNFAAGAERSLINLVNCPRGKKKVDERFLFSL